VYLLLSLRRGLARVGKDEDVFALGVDGLLEVFLAVEVGDGHGG